MRLATYHCRAFGGSKHTGGHLPKVSVPPSHATTRKLHLCKSSLSTPDNRTNCKELEEAWDLLKDYTKKDAFGAAQSWRDSAVKRATLREALLLAASNPWPAAEWNPDVERRDVLMGVLSSDVRMAVRALRDWTAAFGVPTFPIESRVPGVEHAPMVTGTVYIKYNALSELCYVSKYDGSDRGVLISLGQEQLGHFPLGLFDEAMTNPAPLA